MDARPLVRIFLASSQDLAEERRLFESIVRKIGERPNIARQYRLAAVHWQQGGGDTQGRSIQEQIEHSLHFSEIPLVVVLVGTYLGAGTRSEYETARVARRQHGTWPWMLAYFKSNDGTRLVGNEGVLAFQREVISDAVALPGSFMDVPTLEERLGRDVEDLLIRLPRPDPLSGEFLRRAFFVVSAICAALSIALLVVTQTMAFPDNNVSYARVLFVLAGPPLLFVCSSVMMWFLLRLEREFAFAWHSAEYADERIYRVFRNLIPRSVIPQPLRSRFPRDPVGEALNWMLLIVVLALPLVGQFNCIFSELLRWQFVVHPDVVSSRRSPSADDTQTLVKSRYIERGLTWPYGLKAPDVLDAYRRDRGPIYVYSPNGNLGDQGGAQPTTRDMYRKNMGPEVFLPAQPLAYILLFALETVLTVFVFLRLLFLRVIVRRPVANRPNS